MAIFTALRPYGLGLLLAGLATTASAVSIVEVNDNRFTVSNISASSSFDPNLASTFAYQAVDSSEAQTSDIGAVWSDVVGNYQILLLSQSGPPAGQGQLDIPPVPEPETWVMMAVGMGLIAYQLRRKQKSFGAPALRFG